MERQYVIHVRREAWATWLWSASDGPRTIGWGSALTRRGARRAAEREILRQIRRSSSRAKFMYNPKEQA